MIQISSPLKRDFIKGLFEDYEVESFVYTLEKEQGIKLIYSVNKPDQMDRAIRLFKDRIKESDLGRTLFFQVVEI